MNYYNTYHGLVQFFCYAGNSTVLQIDVSVLFIKRKEFVGKIANYSYQWFLQKVRYIEYLKLGLRGIGKRVNENIGSRRRWIRMFLMIETFWRWWTTKEKKEAKIKCLKDGKTVTIDNNRNIKLKFNMW